MNAADLPATQLIQPGSRVSYGGLFAGERAAVDDFKAWLRRHKRAGERLRDITDASPQVRNAVERAGRFLSLASLVSVLLCAIAVAMAARRYVHRHLDTVALLKTLGATAPSRSASRSCSCWRSPSLAALAGSALGFLAQEWLLRTIRGLLAVTELPPAERHAARHRLRDGDRGAGRLCAAAAAAARARAGAARAAARRRSAAAAGAARLRSRGRGRAAPHLLGRARAAAVPVLHRGTRRLRRCCSRCGAGCWCARGPAARPRGRRLALRRRQPQPPPRRERRAARRLRHRHHGAAAARHPAQRPER